jgi:outer membrane protein TolC
MRKSARFVLAFVLTVPLLPSGAGAQEPAGKPLTLNDCVIQAVRKNLGVAVQVVNTRLADISVARAGEKFLPSLQFDFGDRNEKSPAYSWIDSADGVQSAYRNYDAGLSQSLPFGGSLSFSLTGYKSDSNSRFQTINPRFGSTMNFSFSQPLLKDFGWGTSRKDILVARNNREAAENDLKGTLLDLVDRVEQAYWELVYSLESLQVRRQSLSLAEDLLDKSRKEIAIGTLAPKEVLSAQAEVASRKADILQAVQQVKDNSDVLRNLINLPGDSTDADLLPTDRPTLVRNDLSLDDALASAMKNRPDLQSSGLAVKNMELDLSFARNQTLPSLNLTANYWSPGVSGDQILYLDNNPLTGVIIGTLPGGASAALRDAFGLKYRNWSVSLSLQIPLNTVFSRANEAQARTLMEQEIARLKNQEQGVVFEIRAAVRAVRTDYERVDAYKAARELAEQKLEAEQAKMKAGMSSNFMVLQYQRDLASTRTMELRALIDFRRSLGRLEKAMGTALDKWNIKLTDAFSSSGSTSEGE